MVVLAKYPHPFQPALAFRFPDSHPEWNLLTSINGDSTGFPARGISAFQKLE
jgi:hypothetical protein